MERPKTLSAAFVRTVTEPGRYGDGRGSRGLYLRVHPMSNGRVGRSWGQRVRIGGRLTNIGLGSYPVISLATARERAVENARLIAAGGDPRKKPEAIPTFSEAVEMVIPEYSAHWKSDKTARQWRSSLQTYAYPSVGDIPVDKITRSDIITALVSVWGKKDLSAKVAQRISTVMRWAVGKEYRDDNPTIAALEAMPKRNQRTQHHRAVPFADVGGVLATIRESRAWPATKLAFEFLVFTATRSSEARLSTWTEFDVDSSTWIIPPSRTKNGLEYRIPLSTAALTVLRRAGELSDGTGLVFPSPRGKPLSDATISKLLKENGVPCVPHGMRSSFRDWAAECSDAPREIAEFALGHVEGSAAELAYRRTDYFERRRALMDEWAIFVTGQGTGNG